MPHTLKIQITKQNSEIRGWIKSFLPGVYSTHVSACYSSYTSLFSYGSPSENFSNSRNRLIHPSHSSERSRWFLFASNSNCKQKPSHSVCLLFLFNRQHFSRPVLSMPSLRGLLRGLTILESCTVNINKQATFLRDCEKQWQLSTTRQLMEIPLFIYFLLHLISLLMSHAFKEY